LCVYDAEPRLNSGNRFNRVRPAFSDLKKHLFKTAGCNRGEHLTGFVADVSKAVRNIRRQYDNRPWMRVKLIVTASEPINSSYNPEGLGFSGVRMIVGAFAGWSECLPHAQCPASFFRRCMNDNVTTERRWRDPFLTGLRYYCFTEVSQRRTSGLFFLDYSQKLVAGNSSRYTCRMRGSCQA
jgi:hypothetical protein